MSDRETVDIFGYEVPLWPDPEVFGDWWSDSEPTPESPKAPSSEALRSAPERSLWDRWFGADHAESAPKADPRPDAPPRETIAEKIPITLYVGNIGKPRAGKSDETLEEVGSLVYLIHETETKIRRLVAQIQLNGAPPPPVPGVDEETDETPGDAQALEKMRDILRKLRKPKVALTEEHNARLTQILAEVARVVHLTEKNIRGEVAEINKLLADYDAGKGPTFNDAVARLQAGLKNIEGHVERLHEKQKDPAERVKELARDAALIAEAATFDRKAPDSKNAAKKDENKSGGDETRGGGGKEFTDRLAPPGKQDLASNGNDNEKAAGKDPNADVKQKLAEIAERLEEQSEGETEENAQQQQPQPSPLERLAPLGILLASVLGPVAGLLSPAVAAAAQPENRLGPEPFDEDDEADEDGAEEPRDVASAEASAADSKAQPAPGADPKVANLGDRQVPTGSEAEARALELAYRDQDAELPKDAEDSEAMDPALLKKGETGVAAYENGLQRVVGTDEGPLVVSKDQVAAWDPNKAPPEYGNFLGLRDPNRLDAPPAQVTAAPPPPGQTALV